MPEFAPTQKLDKAGIVVRGKMSKARTINNDELENLLSKTEFGEPDEFDEFIDGEFFGLRNELQPYTRVFSDKEKPEGIRNGVNKRFRLNNPPEYHNDNCDFDNFFDEEEEEDSDPLTNPNHPDYNSLSDYTHPDYNPLYDPYNHTYKDPLTDSNNPDYNPLSDYTRQDYNPFTDPLNPDFGSEFP